MQTYSDFFRNEDSVRHYVDVVYRSDDYDAAIWDLQRSFLENWLREFRKSHVRLKGLDFACGTGRIASRTELFTDDIVGLDISADMLEVAKKQTSRTDLRLGDILSEPSIVDYDYDLITAFRFFLNAEADLRARIMRSLAERLRDDRSRLIFNIHGNRHSIRHLTLRMRGGRGTWRNEMSLDEVRRLTDSAGLEIEAWHGFGVLPRFVYRTRMCSAARRIDQFATAAGWLSRISCDLLFICRRKSPCGGSS
jgi:SAM-dependent methyltransferase